MIDPSPFHTRAKTKGASKTAASSGDLLRKVHKKTLSNGMRVLLVPSPGLPVVSHWIWYTVGSRDEGTGETGLSHFLEHMMFKGTTKYPKGSIDLTTARLGGHNNAMTSYDYTAYFFNLKSDRWTEALEIEASRMQNCLLDEQEFESEKKVVIEELLRGMDEPWSPLFEAVSSVAYLVHPYKVPIIGWKQELEGVSADTMRSYYERHYSPDRAVHVVVGDVKPKAAFQEIEATLGALPRSGSPRAEVLDEPPQTGERRIDIRFPGHLYRIAIAWHSCKIGAADDTALDLLSTILGQGKSSRLYKGLVKGKEIVTFAQAYNETRLDPGLFWLVAELKPGTKKERAEKLLLDEIERIADKGPTAAELRRAKKQILASFYFDLEAVSEQASKLGRLEALCEDGYAALLRYPAEMEALRPKDIRDVARKYLTPTNRTIGWSLPTEKA